MITDSSAPAYTVPHSMPGLDELEHDDSQIFSSFSGSIQEIQSAYFIRSNIETQQRGGAARSDAITSGASMMASSLSAHGPVSESRVHSVLRSQLKTQHSKSEHHLGGGLHLLQPESTTTSALHSSGGMGSAIGLHHHHQGGQRLSAHFADESDESRLLQELYYLADALPPQQSRSRNLSSGGFTHERQFSSNAPLVPSPSLAGAGQTPITGAPGGSCNLQAEATTAAPTGHGRVLLFRNLALGTCTADINNLIGPFCHTTPPKTYLQYCHGQAFVELGTVEEAAVACQFFRAHPTLLKGNILQCQFSDRDHVTLPAEKTAKDGVVPSKVILLTVSNLRYPTSNELLRAVFSLYGTVQKIISFSKSASIVQALIQMESIKDAQSCIANLHERNLFDDCNTLQLQPSRLQELSVWQNNARAWDFTGGEGGKAENPLVAAVVALATGGAGASSCAAPDGCGLPPFFLKKLEEVFSTKDEEQHQGEDAGGVGAGTNLLCAIAKHLLPGDEEAPSASDADVTRHLAAQLATVLAPPPPPASILGPVPAAPSSEDGVSTSGTATPSNNGGLLYPSAAAGASPGGGGMSGFLGGAAAPTAVGMGMLGVATTQPPSPLSSPGFLRVLSLPRFPKEMRDWKNNLPMQMNNMLSGVLIIYNLSMNGAGAGSMINELFNIFSLYGIVQRIKVLRDKPDTAMIQYSDPVYASFAQFFLQGVKLFNQEVQISFSRNAEVKPAAPGALDARTREFSVNEQRYSCYKIEKFVKSCCPPTKTLFLADVPEETSERTMREYIGQYGEVVECHFSRPAAIPGEVGPRKTHMFIEMADAQQALVALAKTHRQELGGSALKVAFSKVVF